MALATLGCLAARGNLEQLYSGDSGSKVSLAGNFNDSHLVLLGLWLYPFPLSGEETLYVCVGGVVISHTS